MNERKKDRDILDELLKEKHDPRIPGMDDLDKLTHRRLPPDHGAPSEARPKPAAAPPKQQASPEKAPEKPYDADEENIPFLFVTASPETPGQAKPEAPSPAPQPVASAPKTKPAPKRPARDKAKKRSKHKGAAKKKTTHYLSKETFEELSQAKRAIRKLVPKDIKTGVSKSLIVDSALKLLLDDFEAKGEESVLVRKVLDAKDKS